MKKVLQAIAVTLEVFEKANVRIRWVDHLDAVAVTYFDKGKWNIGLSRQDAQEADANRGNLLCLLHALWHEFGHVYLHSFALVPPMGPYANDPEEIWCDEFANLMCRQFGFKSGWRAPYLEDLL